MAQGVSRRAYAAMRGVSHTAINKAARQGLVFVNDDDTVNVEASDAVWWRRHAFNGRAPVEMDAETAARLDQELAETWTALLRSAENDPELAWLLSPSPRG